MSTEAVAALAKRVANDEAFRDELVAAPDAQARLEVAREAGFDLGPEDMAAVEASLGIRELSDKDLDDVAGGVTSLLNSVRINAVNGSHLSQIDSGYT